MFPLPRVIYAMAIDGLLFQFLGTVSERFKTPVAGTLLSGLFAGDWSLMKKGNLSESNKEEYTSNLFCFVLLFSHRVHGNDVWP